MSVPVGAPRRLSRYVLRAFLGGFVAALFSIIAMFVVIDGAGKVQAAMQAGRHAPLVYVLHYYALHLPMILVQIGPVVTLVAAAFALTRLRRRGELLPILASGVSLHRALRPVGVFALGMVAVSFAIEQWVVPRASAAVRAEGLSRGRSALIYNLLAEDREAGLVVFIGKYTPRSHAMENVHIFEQFGDGPNGGRLSGRLFAWEGAHAPERGWTFRRGYRYDYGPGGTRAGGGRPAVFEELAYPRLTLLPYDLENGASLSLSVGGAAGLQVRPSLSALWRATRAPDAPAAARVHLHSRLAHPFAHLVLLLAGLPLVLRRESRSMVLGALLAGAVCAAYFLLQAACFDLGVRGIISPALAGWAPVGILGAVGGTFIDKLPT